MKKTIFNTKLGKLSTKERQKMKIMGLVDYLISKERNSESDRLNKNN